MAYDAGPDGSGVDVGLGHGPAQVLKRALESLFLDETLDGWMSESPDFEDLPRRRPLFRCPTVAQKVGKVVGMPGFEPGTP
jgi:hypothetical protein